MLFPSTSVCDLLQAVRGFAQQVLLQRRALHLLGGRLETLGCSGDFPGRLVLCLFHLLGCRGLRLIQA